MSTTAHPLLFCPTNITFTLSSSPCYRPFSSSRPHHTSDISDSKFSILYCYSQSHSRIKSFKTCSWLGSFAQTWSLSPQFIYNQPHHRHVHHHYITYSSSMTSSPSVTSSSFPAPENERDELQSHQMQQPDHLHNTRKASSNHNHQAPRKKKLGGGPLDQGTSSATSSVDSVHSNVVPDATNTKASPITPKQHQYKHSGGRPRNTVIATDTNLATSSSSAYPTRPAARPRRLTKDQLLSLTTENYHHTKRTPTGTGNAGQGTTQPVFSPSTASENDSFSHITKSHTNTSSPQNSRNTYPGLGKKLSRAKALTKARQYDRAREIYSNVTFCPLREQDWLQLDSSTHSGTSNLVDLDLVARIVERAFTLKADIYVDWAVLEARAGYMPRARVLFYTAITLLSATPLSSLSSSSSSSLSSLSSPYSISSLSSSLSAPSHVQSVGADDIKAKLFSQQSELDKATRVAKIYHTWAITEERFGFVIQAREAYKSCLKLHAANPIIYQGYAVFEERQGNIADADLVFRTGTLLYPDNTRLLTAWASFEARRGNHTTAVRLFYRAKTSVQAKITPESTKISSKILDEYNISRIYLGWAESEAKKGNYLRADVLFSKAVETCARKPGDIYEAWGVVSCERGQIDRARQLFKTATALDPKYPKSYFEWAKLEQQQEAYDRARELYDEGLSHIPNNTLLLRAWADMEFRLGHIQSIDEWEIPYQQNSPASTQVKIAEVGHNLQMLKRLVQTKTEADLRIALSWIELRSRQDKELYRKITERGEEDTSKLLQWAERRSERDVQAFSSWFAKRYEEDRLSASYIFGWEIPSAKELQKSKKKASTAPRPPQEWLRLAAPLTPDDGDEFLYKDDAQDYARVIHWLSSFADSLSNRTAMAATLLGVALFLIGYVSSAGIYDEIERDGRQVAVTTQARMYTSGVDDKLLNHDMTMMDMYRSEE